MELRKEYAEIVEREQSRWLAAEIDGPDCMTNIALACQELADRPPRELTDAEWLQVWASTVSLSDFSSVQKITFVKTVVNKYLWLQREPQVVKFRAYRDRMEGKIWMARVDADLAPGLEWLEPAQEFEVRI